MKRILVVLAVVAAAASAVFYSSGVLISRNAGTALHYYLVPQVAIDRIRLEVVYFVPRDQVPNPRFYETLNQALSQMQQFHTREFSGASALRFALRPEPVVGRESAAFYDGTDTARGNPGALSRIFRETAERVWRKGGDAHESQFAKRAEGELPVRVFVYQGVGASSGVLSALVAYDYFTATDHGATTLYHELLHNLGVPDAYDYDTGAPQADDIMGEGRTRPLSRTYVRDEIKRRMME